MQHLFYTVGLKRRFFFGWKRHKVTGHQWLDGRLVLDLVDGSQIHVPGVKIRAMKVYPDIRHMLRTIEENRFEQMKQEQLAAQERQLLHYQMQAQAQTQSQPQPQQQHMPAEPLPDLPAEENGGNEMLNLARQKANERVRGILQGNG